MTDDYYIKQALFEAKKAYKLGEVPVGCVIVKNGKIISRAYNKIEKVNDPAAHAEILAIRKAGKKLKNWRLTNCILYSTVEPCPICEAATIQSRIKKVIFGCKRIEKFNSRHIIKECIHNEKCKILLKKFFKTLRNQKK